MSFVTSWEFERHVQQLLDAGADPLDDSAVVTYLDAHPDQLEGFASLLAGVAALHVSGHGSAAPFESPRTHRAPWFAAAAAVLALTWLLWPDAPNAGADTPIVTVATLGPPPSIVRTEVMISHWTPNEVTESRSTDDGPPVVRTSVLHPRRYAIHASGGAPRGVVAATTVHTIE